MNTTQIIRELVEALEIDPTDLPAHEYEVIRQGAIEQGREVLEQQHVPDNDKIERAREAFDKNIDAMASLGLFTKGAASEIKTSFRKHSQPALDEAEALRAERDQLRRLLSDWREQYGDGYGPDGDLIDETDTLLAQEDKDDASLD